ncbi:MAG: PAS domain S-box protein [candidate division WOR-3 bacterium]|nr:MAG: PAS domain S-box protein [candidate division WOR-3 bacterium]
MPLAADISIQAGDLILQLGREGRIIHVNEEAAVTFGYTVEQMLGVPIEVICPRLKFGLVRFDIETIMAGRDFVGGFECARRDGTPLSLYMYATAGTSLPPDGRGKKVVAGVFCVAREVTALWQAEEAVRSSREKYGLLFDLSPDMVVLTTTGGRIVEANQAVSLRSGYSAEQLRSMSILDLVPAEAKRKAELVFAGLWHRKRLKSLLEFQTSDGEAVLVEFNASINRIGGRPMVFAVGRDVSDRVQIERWAQEIGEKYERVFEAIRDGVFLETMDGRILDVNRAACDQLGYSREELLRKSVADLIPVEARSWLPNIREALLREGDLLVEAVNVRKDGTELPVEVRCSRVELGGQTLVLVMTRDIGERKGSEAALRRSEEELRTLQDNVPVGIFRANPAGALLMVNATAVRMYGYGSSEEMLTKTVADLYADAADRDKAAEQLTRNGWLAGMDIEMKRKDGTKFWGSLDARLVADESGAPRFFDCTVQDVADRKMAEQAHRDSEEKYRSVVERAQDGIAVVLGGRLAFVNPALRRMTGYAEDDLVGTYFAGYVPKEERTAAVDLHSRRMAGESGPTTYETAFVHKDGRRLDIEVSASAVRFEGGVADLVFIRDITDRKRIARELEESHRSLATLISSLPGMAYRCRNDRNWTMEFASQGVEALTGYRPEEVVGNEEVAFGDLIHPLDRTFIWNEVQAAIRNQEPFELTYRIRARSGRVKWVWEQGRGVFDEDGGLLALEGLITDITDRKNAEEEARQGLEALRESEQRYSTLFMGTPIGVYRTTPDGRILMANPTLIEMLGYSSFGELQSRNLEQEGFHPGYSREGFKRRIEREGKIMGLESEWTREDGSTVYVRENAKVVRADNGEVLYYEGTVENITEIKRSTEALRDREARLSLMVKRLPAVLWTVDSNLVFTSSVGAGLAALGLKPNQVVGMSLYDYFNTQDPGFPPIAAHHSALEGRTADYGFEWSGNVYRSRVEPLFDSNGKTVGAIGIAHDVTGQTRAEKRARALLQSIPQAVVYQTGGGTEYVSPNVVDMLGYDVDEFTQDRRFFPSLIHPEDSSRVADNLAGWLKRGGEGVLTQEFRVRSRSGEYLWVADHAQIAYRTEDGRSSTLGVLVDLTESRKSRVQLNGSEQGYRRLFDAAPCSASVHQDGKVILANRAMAEMLGFSSVAELVGWPSRDFVHPEDRTTVDEWQQTLLSGGNTGKSLEPLRVRFLSKEGRAVPVEVVGSVVEWSGRPAVQIIVSPHGPSDGYFR